MIIQKAQSTDASRLTGLTIRSKAYWDYSPEQIKIWEPDLTITEAYIRDHEVYILTVGEELIGYYSFYTFSDKVAKLDNLFLEPEHMGKGYGKFLMQEFFRRTNRLGYIKITLDADPNAELFYAHLGFKVVGKLPTSIKDRFLPIMEMEVNEFPEECPKTPYLFQSERLGFRNWSENDIYEMTFISGDPEVMNCFPAVATPKQTKEFMSKMSAMCEEKNYCYFAVDRLEDQQFMGFIGLCEQNFEADFTPCIDIGWRLGKAFWNNGYATEGAKKCLDYAFQELHLKKIISTAPEINMTSIHVMEKIGMKKKSNFKHPRLKGNERLENCVCYEISNPN